MATKVYMEALSPTMEEGRLISWLKNEGDDVKEGDVLAEVATAKATRERAARAWDGGRLLGCLKNEGADVKEGDVLAEVETDKATMELVARGSGVLRKRLIGDRDTAHGRGVLAGIGAAAEAVSR